MAKVYREALLQYSTEQMYGLITDIEKYPEFMSGCIGAELISVGENEVEARLDLGKSGIQQSFTTRNRLTPNERIEMTLVSGPFKKLEGYWELTPLNDAGSQSGSKVSLSLDFETGNSFVMRMVGSMFEETANKLVDAICARANTLYGDATNE